MNGSTPHAAHGESHGSDLPSVLFLHPSAESNGADRAIVQLVSAVDRTRWNPVVVIPRRGPLIGALERAGATIEVGPIGAVREGFAPIRLFSFLLGLPLCLLFVWRMIRRHHPSLVHTHTTAVIGGAIAARLFAKRHLWHVHARLDRSRLGDRATAALLQLLADGIVCGSTACQEALASIRPGLGMRLRVVRNAVDARRVATTDPHQRAAMRAELGVEDFSTLVVMIGRLAPDRGHDLLLEAARKVVALHPYTQFLIVGDTDHRHKGMGRALDRRIEQSDLEGVVRRMPFEGDLSGLYAAADVVCIPAAEPDPTHMVTLEAMAAGRPIVLAEAPGVSEFVEADETGFVFEPGDVDRLAWCVSTLVGDPERRGTMAEAALALHQREFLSGRFKNEFDRAWSQLVDREFVLPARRARVIHLVVGKVGAAPIDGLAHVVNHLATAQAVAGFDVRVWGITADPEAAAPDRPYTLRLFRHSRSRSRLHADLRSAIAALDATAIVHMHGAFSPELHAAAAQLRRRKVPYVVTPHNAYGAAARLSAPESARGGSWARERRMLEGARAVQALSGTELSELQRLLRDQRIYVIPNGQSTFGHPGLPVDAKDARRPVFVYCGRLATRAKGLDVLLEGFTRYAVGRGQGTLWIVGDGEGREELEKQTEELGIQRRVTFFGPLYGDDKVSRLLAADAFVHPSRHEGMPTSALEAGALGLPLLVTPGTNLHDDVDVANAGLVLPEATPEAVVDALFEAENLHASGDLAPRGALAARLFEHRFSWSWIATITARELYELSDEILPAVHAEDPIPTDTSPPPNPQLAPDPGREPRPRRSA